MGIQHLLKNPHFNIFFSVLVGIGLICMIRPQCKGTDCTINKPPVEEDFDKYVYRMEGGKCYEFKTEIIACPASGAVEAFSSPPMTADSLQQYGAFSKRETVIH